MGGSSLAGLFEEVEGFKVPPIERWRPQRVVDLDFRIDGGGGWWHQGGRIGRERMVKLFASLLRIEGDGRHYLITPQVKYVVAVEDAAFQAVELRRRVGEEGGQDLVFRTNVDEVVVAGRGHPIRVREREQEGVVSLVPYVGVRDGLEARICRSVYYELVEWVEEGREGFGVWSGGVFFGLGERG